MDGWARISVSNLNTSQDKLMLDVGFSFDNMWAMHLKNKQANNLRQQSPCKVRTEMFAVSTVGQHCDRLQVYPRVQCQDWNKLPDSRMGVTFKLSFSGRF